MIEQEDKYKGRTYNRFWYSLDIFIPAIDLDAAKAWKPKEECKHAIHYMRACRLVGWVLIPIGLAAMTGIIK